MCKTDAKYYAPEQFTTEDFIRIALKVPQWKDLYRCFYHATEDSITAVYVGVNKEYEIVIGCKGKSAHAEYKEKLSNGEVYWFRYDFIEAFGKHCFGKNSYVGEEFC